MGASYHPQFVAVVAHKDCPVLRGIWVVLDLFGDLLAKSCLFCKPFASEAGDWMPANLHDAFLAVDISFGRRDNVRFVTQTERVFKDELPFQQLILSPGNAFFSAIRVSCAPCICNLARRDSAYRNIFILLRFDCGASAGA